jgi:hypothetical protein
VLRSHFRKTSIGTPLGLALALACMPTTPAHAGLDQQWYLGASDHNAANNGTLPYNSNIISLYNSSQGFDTCVDAEGLSAANGTRVITFNCGEGNNGIFQVWNQRWINDQGWCTNPYVPYNDPVLGQRNVNPPCVRGALWFSLAVGDNWGACIDVPGGNDANGQALQIYQCNGTPAQVWRPGLPAYGESSLWIRSNITGQGVNRCWTNWGKVVLYDCAYDLIY